MLLLVLILVLGAFALLVVALVQGSVTWAWLSVGISVAAAGVLLFDWWQRQQAARDEEVLPPAPQLRPPAASADYDSVTEFIPVMPRQGGPGSAEADAETRFIPQSLPDETEQTVLLPTTRPSGSADQPPGATPPNEPWIASQSRSVTAPGPQAAPPPPSTWTGVPADDVAEDAEDITVVEQRPDPEPPDADATEIEEAPEPGGDGVPTAIMPTDPPEPPTDTDDGFGTGADDTEIAAPSLPPAGPDGEPPEEAVEGDAATAVADLQDEVVVVDERPRYHVGECTFLPGRPVIPLPVAEAVELGFSPCGWCTPVRVLDERRRATAR